MALSFPAWADTTGLVVSVHDGDTLTVLVGKQQIKVRLAEIDAPELRQPYISPTRQKEHIAVCVNCRPKGLK